ncbi:MAG TPA: protein kinase [Polyangiaceae bacterium]
MAAEDQLPLSGEVTRVASVGRYRLFAELARGGMGVVYLALVRGPGNFNKLFVVKVLKAHLAEDPKLVAMFLEEARLAAKLSHPNVVQTIEVGSDAGCHYIAMEFLDGQSLYDALSRAKRSGERMPLHYQLHVLVHLLEGLQYAHEAKDFDGARLNLVHRDVSPHNVFLSYDGQIKILDFGIAKALDSTHDTRTGVLKGKIAYMAPEQAAGESLDRRADVFAAGVILWEAIVGRRMWDRSLRDMQILHALMKAEIPQPRAHAPDIDPRVETIILKATAPRADDRYTTAAEMQGDVEAYLAAIGAPSFGSRDVGRYVTALFGEERERIRAAIDEQVGLLRGVSSGAYSKITMRKLSIAPPGQGTPSGVLLTTSDPGAQTVTGPPEPSGSYEDARATVPPPAKLRRRRRTIATASLVIVGIVAVAAAGLLFHAQVTASSEASPSAVPTTPSVPAATTSTRAAASASATAAVASDPGAPPASVAATPSAAPARSETTNGPPHVPGPTRGGGARAVAVENVPTAAPTPTPPGTTTAPAPTETTHVRQQIDTANPYGH